MSMGDRQGGSRGGHWPVAGAHARIRGDLTETELIAIAAGTTVGNGGRPFTRPPDTRWCRPDVPAPDIHEARYGGSSVAEQAALVTA